MNPAPVPALQLHDIRKSFGTTRALRGVALGLAPGEVHALVGENGAGKSTLTHIAYGMTAPDTGTIAVDGRMVRLRSPRDARTHGIGMVHQHFTSIGALTIRENIALAVGPGARGRTGAPAHGFLEGMSPTRMVSELSVAERQRLEIAKALATGARILLLDEPTAVLAPSEVDRLLVEIREFARAGGAVALITHKLREVLQAADRVTVLRRGLVTLAGPIEEQTERTLALAMVGEEGGEDRARPAKTGKDRGSPGKTGVTVQIGGLGLRAGELVGVAAVEGNGHREILRAIAGLTRHQGIAVHGTVAFVPEDRTTEGLIPELDVTENVVLGLPEDPRWARGVRIDWPSARRRTGELIEEFEVVAQGPNAAMNSLSGGNQQKVVLARALERHPAILVAENPTRGLDVRTTEEMHRRLRDAARAGATVIVYSTDLDEVLALGDRHLVVFRGEVREAPPERRVVGQMMLGVDERRET